MNGKPAEPVEQLPVPRQRQKAVNPSKPIGKEELYGLQTDPPSPDSGLKGFSLNTYTPNRNKGAKPKPGGYGVLIHKMEYGKTGSVTGVVTLNDNDPRLRKGPIASNFCKDGGTKPIGEVIQSDEDAVRISVDADLCQAGPSTMQQCERGGCPVVDHLTSEVSIAFGWRQFSDTAPTDIRTPGIQRYINTMPDSLQEAMNFGANTALPDFDDFSATGGDGDGSGDDDGVNRWIVQQTAKTATPSAWQR